jgi:rhodanese-related sulfurtransferase
MIRTQFYFYVLLVTFFLSCNQKEAQEGLVNVSPEIFQDLINIEGAQLIDVRTEKEFAEGQISGAKNIDYFSKDFPEQISKLNKDRPVFIYCRSGKRSLKSVSKFKEVGWVEIYNLEGGILGWESQGLTIDYKD